MNTLSKYDDWALSEPKVARPQMDMEITTILATQPDTLVKGALRKMVILIVTNNNTQFEVMMPLDSWRQIAR